MKINRLRPSTVTWMTAILLSSTIQSGFAQSRGYISGATIQPFDPATGALLEGTLSPNPGGTPAVGQGGATLYSPQISFQSPTLEVFATEGWQISERIQGMAPNGGGKVILDPTGTYAFVMGQGTQTNNAVAVVNLTKQAVVAYIHAANGSLMDIALSPSGKQLFVSTFHSGGGSHAIPAPAPVSDVQQTVYECKAVPGICVFNTTPSFAADGQVSNVSGYLAVSQDGKSLYATTEDYNFFWLVNTSSLNISQIPITSGYQAEAIAVAPSGNQAVLLAENGTVSAFLLNTETNKITGTLPIPPNTLVDVASGSNVMAFSPDGTSLWTIAGFPSQSLIGQSFPSGKLIAETPLAANSNALAVIF